MSQVPNARYAFRDRGNLFLGTRAKFQAFVQSLRSLEAEIPTLVFATPQADSDEVDFSFGGATYKLRHGPAPIGDLSASRIPVTVLRLDGDKHVPVSGRVIYLDLPGNIHREAEGRSSMWCVPDDCEVAFYFLMTDGK